jgi:hypothetical protein
LAELGARDVCVDPTIHRSLLLNASINALIDALIVCSFPKHPLLFLCVPLLCCRKLPFRCYSVFDSAANRMQNAKGQSPQEIDLSRGTGDVNK